MSTIGPATEVHIRKHFRCFLNDRIHSIAKLTIWDFELNPFLIACVKNQMKLKTPEELAQWLVRQRIERGLVTGFGKTLQKIAKEFSKEEPLPGLTMKLKRNRTVYNLMIKSGPNPYPMQPAIDMQRILLETKKQDPKSIPIFCMCYGNENALSNIVKTYMNEVKHLVGKDFWAFISEDPECEKKILKIAKEEGNGFRDKEGNTLYHMVEKKIKYMEMELKKLYGSDNNTFWEHVLEDVY